MISTGNGQPKRPFSGVYASLGQRDQDSVYQDLDTVASPATPQQASNSKPEQPSSSGAYVDERYRNQENECQELAPQTIGPTVHHHVNKDTPKSCQTLQQLSGECANVMVPKDVYKDASDSTTPSVAIMDQHSNTNNTTPKVFQKDKANDNQEMSAVTTTSPSTLISTGNKELQQTSSRVYASLGQIDQDSVYQDLAKATSTAWKNACQEMAPQTIDSTVHHHDSEEEPKSCQTLQMSSWCVKVMGTKDEYKGAGTTMGATVGPHSKPNKLLTTALAVCQNNKATDDQELSVVTTTSPSTLIPTSNRQPQQPLTEVYASLGQRDQDIVYQDLATVASPATISQASTRQPKQPSSSGVCASPTDVESPEVDNIYDEPNLGDKESDFTHRREQAGTISEPGRKCVIQLLKKVIRITLIPIVLCIVAVMVIIVTIRWKIIEQ